MGTIESNLADLRESRGWSLRQLSRMTGIAISTLSEYERGLRTPWLDDIPKLREAFGEPVHFYINVTPATKKGTV